MRAGSSHDVPNRDRGQRHRTRQAAVFAARLASAVFLVTVLLPVSVTFAQQTPVVTGNEKTFDQAINFYVSEDALQAQYERPVSISRLGSTTVRAGFFYNEDRDLIFVGDLLAYTGK